jgi:hypothetical protein
MRDTDRPPMIQRNPRRAWPLLFVVGVPCSLLLAASQFAGPLGIVDATVTTFASVAALIASAAGCHRALLGPHRAGGAALVIASALAVGGALEIDAARDVNRQPPGWPAGLPRFPGVWTGQGSARPGDPARFEAIFTGRSRSLRSYRAEHPEGRRVSMPDGCDGVVIGRHTVVECLSDRRWSVEVRGGE